MNTEILSPQIIRHVMAYKGYPVHSNQSKNYNLNLIGIRTKDEAADLFNDYFIVMWRHLNLWNMLVHSCTTNPGAYYLGSKMGSKKGTAIMKPGYYKHLWKHGKHKGYTALQQINPVTVLRDDNTDGSPDYDTAKEETGMFGINAHRGKQLGTTRKVGPYSAGCIVHQNAEEFSTTLHLTKMASKLWGNKFSFALLEESDFVG